MEKQFLEFAASVLGVDSSAISLETEYMEIPEWDSLMQLTLMAEISDEYNVEIPIDKLSGIRKLGDFYGYVEKKRD